MASSLDAMDTMMRQLTQTQEIVEGMRVQVRRTYESIGSEWHDPQYDKMNSEISEIEQALSACYVALSNGQSRLSVRRQALQDYLSMP